MQRGAQQNMLLIIDVNVEVNVDVNVNLDVDILSYTNMATIDLKNAWWAIINQ